MNREQEKSQGYKDITEAYKDRPNAVILKESHANILKDIHEQSDFSRQVHAEWILVGGKKYRVYDAADVAQYMQEAAENESQLTAEQRVVAPLVYFALEQESGNYHSSVAGYEDIFTDVDPQTDDVQKFHMYLQKFREVIQRHVHVARNFGPIFAEAQKIPWSSIYSDEERIGKNQKVLEVVKNVAEAHQKMATLEDEVARIVAIAESKLTQFK